MTIPTKLCLVPLGVRRRGYNKLSRDNNNVAASETSQQHTHHQQGNSGMTTLLEQAAALEEDKGRRLSNECPSSSYLSTPISEMDEDSDDGHSWGNSSFIALLSWVAIWLRESLRCPTFMNINRPRSQQWLIHVKLWKKGLKSDTLS